MNSRSGREGRRRSRSFVAIGALTLWAVLVPAGSAAPAVAGAVATPVAATAAAADLEDVLEAHLAAGGVPGGAAVVVDRGGRVDVTVVGDAGDEPIRATTPFVIGSATKSFTALAVLQLVDAGAVRLDEPVCTYVPEFRLAPGEPVDVITVRHVLQQTSGLPGTAAGPLLSSARDGTPLEALAEIRDARLADVLGRSWRYANVNYVLAGLVVERASGMTYGDYVEQRIFAPLGMTGSSASVVPGTARGHRLWFGAAIASGPVHRDAVLAAGYLVVTPEDLGRYLAMLLRGGVSADGTRVVSAGSLDLLFRAGPQVSLGPWADGATAHYAMGWFAGGPWAEPGFMHPGNAPDSSAMVAVFPGRGVAVGTLLAVGHELPVPGNPAVTDRISRAVVHAALGEPVPEPTSLTGLYVVFDLVALGLIAAAASGLLHAVRRLRTGARSRRRAWAGAVAYAALALLLAATPVVLYFGWAALWVWAPDLALVLAVLAALTTATALVRVAGLVRRGGVAGTEQTAARGARSPVRTGSPRMTIRDCDHGLIRRPGRV